MDANSTIVKTVLALINSQGFETTPRLIAPQVEEINPLHLLESNKVYPEVYEVYQEEIFSSWRKHRPQLAPINPDKIADGSLAGQIIQYADQQVLDFESQLKKSIENLYRQNLDETYQNLIYYAVTFGKSTWKMVLPRINYIIENSRINGLVQSENYYLAQTFCDLQHQRLAAEIDILRLFLLKTPDNTYTFTTREVVADRLAQHVKRFFWWQQCLLDLKKFNELYHQVYSFQQLFESLWLSSTDDFEESGALFANFVKYDQALLELKASFYNHFTTNFPKSWAKLKIQQVFNSVADKIAELSGNIYKARSLDVVTEELSSFVKNDYKFLKAKKGESADLKNLIDIYLDAILKDNFILASYLCMSANQKEGVFDWPRQASQLEQYKEKVDHIISYQQKIDDVIANLFLLSEHLFCKASSKEIKAEYLDEIEMIIKQLREYSARLDVLRLDLRNGYLKEIKTLYNTSNKDLIERGVTSSKNKVLRWLLSNVFFDQTKPYSDVKNDYAHEIKNFERLIFHVSGLFAEIRKEPKAELEVFDSFYTGLPIKTVVSRSVNYPLFENLLEFYQFILERDIKDPLSREIIEYNCQQNKDYSDQWRSELELFTIYQQLSSDFEKIIKQTNKMILRISSFSALDYPAKAIIQNLKRDGVDANKYLQIMPEQYKKYFLTIFNRQDPLTVERITASFFRKINRVLSEFAISDQTLSITDAIPGYQKDLEKMKVTLNNAKWLIGQMQSQRSVGSSTSLPRERELNLDELLEADFSPSPSSYDSRSLSRRQHTRQHEDKPLPSDQSDFLLQMLPHTISSPISIPGRSGDRQTAMSAPSKLIGGTQFVMVENYFEEGHKKKDTSKKSSTVVDTDF